MHAGPVLEVDFDPLKNTLTTKDKIINAIRSGRIKVLAQSEIDQIIAEQTDGGSKVTELRTGTRLIPTRDGLAVDLHPDLQRRSPDAVVSSKPIQVARSYLTRFASEFKSRARSMLKVLMRGREHKHDPETEMVAAFLKTNINDGAVLVVVPKYLAYTLKAGSILQGAHENTLDQLEAEGKIQGVIIDVPLFRDKHAKANGKDPAENWEQVVVHTGERSFPIVYAFTEYPGPSLKKALYAIGMYLCCNGISAENAKFPFHGAAAVIVSGDKKITLATFGASGAGKTETWFNPIYLSGVAEETGISPELINELWMKSPILSCVDRYGVDIKILPAGDDILMIYKGPDGKLVAINLEQQGIFLRPDGSEVQVLRNLMAGRNDFVFLNYRNCLLGEPVDLSDFNPNPRIFYHNDAIPSQQMRDESDLDVLNLGVRCSQSTLEKTGLCLGLVHLVSPQMLRMLNSNLMRASKGNPSINGSSEDVITGEGPGSVSGFLTPEETGRSYYAMDRVLREVGRETCCVLTASQNIGAKGDLGFAGQQALTLNLVSENSVRDMTRKDLIYSGHPLLGHVPKKLELQDGEYADELLLHPWKQKELGVDGWFNALNEINDFYLNQIECLLENFSSDLDDQLHALLIDTREILVAWKGEAIQHAEKLQLEMSMTDPDEDYYYSRQEAVYDLLDKSKLI